MSARATTSELYDAIRQGFSDLGIQPGPIDIQDINYLRSNAAAIRNSGEIAGEALTTYRDTGLDQAVTGDMVAQPWWGRGLLTQEAGPLYQIRAQVEYENPLWRAGVPDQPETLTEWVTLKPAVLPQSMTQLEAELQRVVGKKGKSPIPGFRQATDYQIQQV